jgi:2,3-bisphosphoglycerate-dependent phosphoglycerate mutase
MPWPKHLWIVRHGESAGNVARDKAHADGVETIAIDGRDVDVPLSDRGRTQASALAQWFESMHDDKRPTVLLSSPYARAFETAQLIGDRIGVSVLVDERLREKEFGSLNRLTRLGITQRYPEEAERRKAVGKFYYRPPGGESWCDVILRLRGFADSLRARFARDEHRVVIATHQVVVLCLRYIIEEMNEHEILAIDSAADVANCGTTEYARESGDASRSKLRLVRYNFVAPLVAAGASVTARPDAPTAAP